MTMASIMKICRLSVAKSLYNIGPGSCNNNLNLALRRRSNHIYGVANSVRWGIQRVPYSSSVKSSSNENSGSTSQLVNEILASKVNEKQDTNPPKPEFEVDEKNAEEERERTRRATKFSFIACGVIIAGMGGTLFWRWGSPPEDEMGVVMKDELSHLPIVEQYFKRTYREMRMMNKMIQEPSRDKLLPDILSGQYVQPSYTLVLELRDVLVHPQWTLENGWRFKKRPGIDYMLQHCAPPHFEIVVYTAEQGMTLFPVIDKVDPNGFIWYRLFKDSTLYVDGKHIKELNCLNRDLKKVIMVDWDSDAVSCSRNLLKVPRWNGNSDDKGLVHLGMLLRTIAESEVDDVRDVLDYYRQFDDPLEAYTKLQQEALALDQQREEKKKEDIKQGVTWSPSFVKKWK